MLTEWVLSVFKIADGAFSLQLDQKQERLKKLKNNRYLWGEEGFPNLGSVQTSKGLLKCFMVCLNANLLPRNY